MWIDLVIALFALLMCISGYRKGFFRQATLVLSLLALLFFSRPLAEIAAKILEREFQLPSHTLVAQLVLISFSAALLMSLCHLLGRWLRNTLVKGVEFAEKTDQYFGASLGFLLSILLSYAILCFLALLDGKVQNYAPKLSQALHQSLSYQLAHEHNALRTEFFQLNALDSPLKNLLKSPAATPLLSPTEPQEVLTPEVTDNAPPPAKRP